MAAGRVEPPGTGALRFRTALPTDAVRISRFYAECYASSDGRTASDNYPFPQVLHPDWVEAMLTTRMIRWVLAEAGARTVGAAGLLKGLGRRADGIVECFGLVVDPSYRGYGLGTGVLDLLNELVRGEATVALGQMRTVDPAAAQVVERAGFIPIGFEPFVHRMLAGEESMVAVAMLPPGALKRRALTGQTTATVRRLAEIVLEPLGCPSLEVSRETVRASRRFRKRLRLQEVYAEIGAYLLAQLPTSQPRVPRFVDLRRMDELGREHSRRKDRFFVALRGDDVIGCIQVAHNRHDRHFRIDAMASHPREAQPTMLQLLIELVAEESEGQPHAIVADLIASRVTQQCALEAAGFVPTSYHPALIALGKRRLDVVQYTRLQGYAVSRSSECLDDMRWSTAERLVRHVTSTLANHAPRTVDPPPMTDAHRNPRSAAAPRRGTATRGLRATSSANVPSPAGNVALAEIDT
jgi:hypothetical protein